MIPSLALVILTKNQKSQAEKILQDTHGLFDAVYVLDDDSTDGVEQLKNATVFRHTLGESFAQHRNWILTKIKEDWTFFLDADEEVSPELVYEMRQAMQDERILAFTVQRLDVFDGHILRYGETGNMRIVRLAQTQVGQGQWKRTVHETWDFPTIKVRHLKTPLLHFAHNDVASFMAKLHRYAALEKSERKERGFYELLWEMFTYPLAKFLQNYVWKQGWRDGFAGFVYAALMSYYSLIKRVFWYEDLVS